jgi:AcrR family transcriptional regulator
VPRQTKQQIDDEIVEQASVLFARHGFKDTSVQSIANAAGYSKTGLLHRFPSKEALWAAVVERCVGMCRQIADDVADLPVGPDRDRAVLTGLVDLTLAHPGVVALLLSVFSTIDFNRGSVAGGGDTVEDTPLLRGIGESVIGAFGDGPLTPEPPSPAQLPRRVRVVGALGALAVAGIALRDASRDDVREQLIAAAYDTLGHAHQAQIPTARQAQ